MTPQSMGDVMRALLQENRMDSRLDEFKAIEVWPSVVGNHIAGECGRMFVKAGVLTVSVPNAALRHELTMSRSPLMREINRVIGKPVLTEIRFIS